MVLNDQTVKQLVENLDARSEVFLRADDVLVQRSNTLELVGTTAVFDGPNDVYAYPDLMMRLRFKSAAVGHWFWRYANSSSGRRYFVSVAAGSTGTMPKISGARLRDMPVPLPPSHEQDVIAEALSDADALIESLEQLLSKKRQIKQGAMQELLRPKPVDDVRLLGDVSSLKGRIGWQGLKQSEFTANDDEPFLITGMNFKDGAIRWNEVYHISEARYELAPEIQLRPRDVLMTKDGTIGKVLYIDAIPYPGKASLNSHLLLFRPVGASYNPKYLYYQLGSRRFKDFVELSKSGTTFFGLSQAAVADYPVVLPPLVEQARIAAVLSDMDIAIAACEAQLAKARQIKQGMVQELLTGRTRLVKQATTFVRSIPPTKSTSTSAKSHNWQINEAVVISVLTKRFGSGRFPLGRKRCTKLSYLLHRHVEQVTDGYLKKVAGPYNPSVKYKGPEGIAQRNGYIRPHRSEQYAGFVAAENIGQAEAYFAKWYGEERLAWLEQFRHKTNDELELLATVDMAMVDLRRSNKAEQLVNVKRVIRDHPEWEAKLSRAIFSDDNIVSAMKTCQRLFRSEE